MDEHYFAIHPQVLRIDTALSFDVFVRTAKDKHDLLFKSGKQYTALIHAKIFKYSISALYVSTTELQHYYSYLEENVDVVFGDFLISSKSKAKITHELVTSLAKLVLENPDADITVRYKKIVTLIADFIFTTDDAVKHLISFTSSSFQDYNHLVNVGIYSLGLLKEILKETDKHNIGEIACGFFLHDLGKHDIPKHITQKNGQLTPDEWKLIKQHPEKGFRLMEQFSLESEEIRIILLQHHERHNGSGYPLGLTGDQIHMYSKICAIADIFDALTSHRPYRYAQSSFKALKVMQTEMRKEFDPGLFSRFVLMFSKQG